MKEKRILVNWHALLSVNIKRTCDQENELSIIKFKFCSIMHNLYLLGVA